MVSWLAGAAAVACLVLAGCTGTSAAPDGVTLGDGSTLALHAQENQAGRGGIAGVVVDEAIRPIPAANVTLGASGKWVQADGAGRFAFPNLEPGFYALTAAAPGFFPIQATADVKAGETAKARIQLQADRSPQPYHQTTKFQGFLEAWAGVGQYFVEELYAGTAGNSTALCQCMYTFTPDADLAGIVFEAVWTETVPHPAGLGDAEFYALVEQPDGPMFADHYCTSPCRYDVDLAEYQPGLAARALLQGPDLYVSFEQSYEVFLTLFYREAQPEGWSFVGGDT